MPLPTLLQNRLDLPVIGAPMLLPCSPPLTIAQCTSGIVGAFPALSARPAEQLDEWLAEISEALSAFAAKNPGKKVAPFAVNQIVHKTNPRLDRDMETVIKHKVPMVVTSLGANADVVKAVHAYGGIVFHDVAQARHAERALEQGVDGLVLLCAGAGGHGGSLNPFAFVAEVRRFWKGPLAVAGGITTGDAVAAVRAMGADLAYIGTRFAASVESRIDDNYKSHILRCTAKDILFTPYFSGVHTSLMKTSIAACGFDPDDPKLLLKSDATYGIDTTKENPKRWTELLAAGQGVGNIDAILPVAGIVATLKREYAAALDGLRA